MLPDTDHDEHHGGNHTPDDQLAWCVGPKHISVTNSFCAHHFLPFTGTVAVGYLPNKWIIGLSKIPRLINVVAGRPQIQENFTKHIRDHLAQLVETVDVAVVVRGRHACMEVRGVKSSGEMVTSAMRGAFRDNAQTRAEFMSIIGA